MRDIPRLAGHNSQKNRKGKVCWQSELLGCAKFDSLSQHELVGNLCRCVSNEIKLDDGNSPSNINI